MRQVLCLLLVPAAFLGCESAMQPEAPVEGLRIQANGGKAVASVKGDGHYLLSGALDIKFQLNARVRADGSASGKFGQSLIFGGQLIKFQGTVTCVSFDPVNGRAWIGGVVKNNAPGMFLPMDAGGGIRHGGCVGVGRLAGPGYFKRGRLMLGAS